MSAGIIAAHEVLGGGGGGSVSRFYLPSTGTPALLTAPFDAWTTTANAVRKPLSITRSGTADAEIDPTTSGGSNRTCLVAQYVTPALAAQVLTGLTSKGQMRARKTNITNITRRMSVGLFDASGTLITRVASRVGSPALVNGTSTNGPLPTVTWPSPFTIPANSFLCFEIGHFNPNDSTNGARSIISVGDNDGTDLPEDSVTTTALNAWIEFSQALTLL